MTTPPSAHSPLIPLDRALDTLVEGWHPVTGVEPVPILEAVRRVLAEDVVAKVSAPRFDSAGMDGFAVRSVESPAVCQIAARVAAGHVQQEDLPPGVAIRIFTGAPLPSGFDSVAMQENCRVEGDRVHLPAGMRPGDHVRLTGSDFRAGDAVLERGRRLRPQDIAVCAAAGHATVRVHAPLRVGVFSTGDELTEPGKPLGDGAVYNCNRYAIAAFCAELGCRVVDLGNIPDSLDETVSRLRDAAGDCDLLITSGGMSVGGEDHVRDAVKQLGALHLWRMAVKPGKPTAIGAVCGVPFIGLPGYPVSSMVTFMLIARPAILRLSGAIGESVRPPRFPVRAAFSFDKDEERRQFLRASLRSGPDGGLEAVLYPTQESNVTSSLVRSDGLVDLAETRATVRPGDTVDFIPYAEMRV